MFFNISDLSYFSIKNRGIANLNINCERNQISLVRDIQLCKKTYLAIKYAVRLLCNENYNFPRKEMNKCMKILNLNPQRSLS